MAKTPELNKQTAVDLSHAEICALEGKVCSGLGEGSSFMQMDWVLQQFFSKFGLTPFPGTFNLDMTGPQWEQVLTRLQEAEGVRIVPPEGFCSAKCFPVVLQGRGQGQVEGISIFPEVSGYPARKFEVVAAVAVRQALQLKDGDAVKVQLYIK